MAIALYLNAHIPKAITIGLRLRGVDVITAQEDNVANLSDLRPSLARFDRDLRP